MLSDTLERIDTTSFQAIPIKGNCTIGIAAVNAPDATIRMTIL